MTPLVSFLVGVVVGMAFVMVLGVWLQARSRSIEARKMAALDERKGQANNRSEGSAFNTAGGP